VPPGVVGDHLRVGGVADATQRVAAQAQDPTEQQLTGGGIRRLG
jgi:hypothetical protein